MGTAQQRRAGARAHANTAAAAGSPHNGGWGSCCGKKKSNTYMLPYSSGWDALCPPQHANKKTHLYVHVQIGRLCLCIHYPVTLRRPRTPGCTRRVVHGCHMSAITQPQSTCQSPRLPTCRSTCSQGAGQSASQQAVTAAVVQWGFFQRLMLLLGPLDHRILQYIYRQLCRCP
jgi:hypothetical protein